MMKTETLKINKERLMAIAEKPSDEAIKRRSQRKSERQLVLAFTLIASKIARAMRMQNIKNIEVAKIQTAPQNFYIILRCSSFLHSLCRFLKKVDSVLYVY